MRTINIKLFFLLFMLLPLFFTSCDKDEDNENVTIDSVWLNMNGVESTQINSCFTTQWIRLEGSGFNGLTEIYCNNVKASFSPILNTSKYITFQVPTGVPIAQEITDETIKNTIRIVTTHGEYTYSNFNFKDKNKMPGVNSVSYTFPKPGDKIYLDGLYLGATTEINFPGPSGEVKATEYSIINDKRIQVTVPAGVGSVSGAIRIVADGDIYYSPAYMFYSQGIFLKTFLETDVLVPGTYANTKVYSDPIQITALTGLTNNPDNIMAIPEVAKNIAVATGTSVSSNFFKFYAYKGFNKVIANSNSGIIKTSKLENLAIQFDLYIKNPWNSGVIAFKMNKNNSGKNAQYIYNIAPWTTTNPYTFENGWRTITVKFSDFPSLALGTLDSYITAITSNNYEAMLAFANYDMNADGHAPQALTNFQMYIANVRLVPTTTPN
jgi:hypothetical protein